jgi:serine/threonine-protein kinase
MTDALARLAAALGHSYRLDRELGQGGMATVYLAEDLKHDRRVALKVLRPELAAVIGAERFLKEIKVTANLQHPHILGLIDSGEVDGLLWYAMPFVEGESLRDRLQREKQLPIPEAVRLATEVAGALDYAHRHGVIHRDIKPENILLHDGSALVADFGIALAASSAGTRMTETGMSLGTPHYMSPEQAMGEREITARSDVYALGCISYEMLTGDPPFTGSTAQAIVAKVVTERPHALRSQRHTIPPHIEAAVLTALEKLPADRFATAAEFAAALADRGYTSTTMAVVAGGSSEGRRWRLVAAALAMALLATAIAAVVGWMRQPPPGMVRRFDVALTGTYPNFASPLFSPDGSRLIYASLEGALQLRDADALDARPIPGSESAWSPVFSPDSRALAINTGFPGAIKILPLAGGAVRTLVADSTFGQGLDWSTDDWIYYLHGEHYGRDLMRIRATGGSPEFVARPDSASAILMFLYPQVLPGGRILLTLQMKDGDPKAGILDPGTGALTILADGVLSRYAPTGHLIVAGVDGTLQAARFDAPAGTLRGSFTPVAEGLAVSLFSGTGVFTLSEEGTLGYQRTPTPHQVVRVPRDGSQEEALDPGWQDRFASVSLAPDGSRLAIAVERAGRTELWVRSLETGAMTRLSSGGTWNYRPSWSPDGREVVFTSDQRGKITTYRVRADGSARPEPLLAVTPSVDEAVYSRDGEWLIYRGGSGGGRDIFARRTAGDTTDLALVNSRAEEFSPTLSPDGRWLAYASDETGRTEVYVRPFPDAGAAKFTVSRNGGSEPLWNPAGGELFYRDGNDALVAVGVAPGNEFRVMSTRVLFSTRGYVADNRHRTYSVSADGRSFVFVKSPDLLDMDSQLVVTLNWFEELKRKVDQ